MKRASLGLALLVLIGFLLIDFGYAFQHSGASLVGICILLGLIIKSMDQLIDVARFRANRILIAPFAISIPLMMGYLAYTHDPVFGMVIGTAIGLVLSGKIDHKAYVLSILAFLAVVALLVLFGNLHIAMTSVYIIPFAVAGSYLDELGVEKVRAKKAAGPLRQFFEHRSVLKITAVICTALGFAQIIHLIAFFCFDIAYDITASLLR
jgi:hypothetical protein